MHTVLSSNQTANNLFKCAQRRFRGSLRLEIHTWLRGGPLGAITTHFNYKRHVRSWNKSRLGWAIKKKKKPRAIGFTGAPLIILSFHALPNTLAHKCVFSFFFFFGGTRWIIFILIKCWKFALSTTSSYHCAAECFPLPVSLPRRLPCLQPRDSRGASRPINLYTSFITISVAHCSPPQICLLLSFTRRPFI